MHTGLPLYSVDQVRAIDSAAIERLGIAAFELMARAGAAALKVARQRWPEAGSLLVACGSGNNGGDGYVLARLAREAGLQVRVVAAHGHAPRSAQAQRALAGWREAGGEAAVFDGQLPEADLLVDALFGVGLQQPPREPSAALIRAINAQSAPVLSLDVPSGIDADTGHAPGEAVRAHATVVFIARKCGLHTGVARACTGTMVLAPLQVPAALTDEFAPQARLLQPEALRAMLAPRRSDAHKGDFGHVLVVGGEQGMGGAAALAAQAAARAGAGLVSVATRQRHVSALLALQPELMVHAVESSPELAPLLQRCDVVAAGPGLGTGEWGRALLAQVLRAQRPLVLDADALNLLAESGGSAPADAAVLTPHPGEAARLLACSTAEVQRDRFFAAAQLAQRHRATVVLKGAGSIVAARGRVPAVIDGGNPGMASGGMGDVLTGIVAALRAQGQPAFEAACAGALLHAAAGDAAARGGQRGLLAGDLLAPLRRLANPEPA